MGDYRSFDDLLKERLRQDPEEAQAYIEVALEEYEEDRDSATLLRALRIVAEVQGSIPALARKVGMSKQALYKVFSETGNPRLDTIWAILHGLGYRLVLMPIEKESTAVSSRF